MTQLLPHLFSLMSMLVRHRFMPLGFLSGLLLLLTTIQIQAATVKGSLFIVGGSLDTTLALRMVELANARTGGYIVVLPLASEIPDSVSADAVKLFESQDVRAVSSMFVGQTDTASQQQLDSLLGARLIYFTGGDQNRLMQLINQLKIRETLQLAYQQGAMLAGSSAGAAVMSKWMITGNQLKSSDYEATFSRLQAGNLELAEGLGFIEKAVIDQHFITRSRYNRLLSVVLEKRGMKGVGIDEKTAIYVKDGRAEVYGASQVVVITSRKARPPQDGLLSSTNVRLTILWAGDRFTLH